MKDQEKIQELQILEQSIQNILMQKQAFQMELSETEAALNELGKSGDEVFKIIGQLMIKSDKSTIKEELTEKQKLFGIRMKNLEKQESSLALQIEKLRDEIMNSSKK